MTGDGAEEALAALVEQISAGRRRAVGRALTLVENDSPHLPELMRQLLPWYGRAHVVGLTGAPGVGKSTLTAGVIGALRAAGHRVGVLAVDPSSPYSGGALLGDRIRMAEHTTDGGVWIRSVATRGHLGGLSAATPQAVRVLDAAGCDTVLIETVGVGQSEVDVARACDTTVVVMAPGMGDAIQAAKAGVLEIGDVYVVNKSDRPDAQSVVRDLRTMIALTQRESGYWKPPIISTVAVSGQGLAEILQQVTAHRSHGEADGAWPRRRARRAAREVESLVLGTLQRRLRIDPAQGARMAELGRAVRDQELDPYRASELVLTELSG